MKHRIANMSKLQNFSHSRLPLLSAEEVKLIRGSSDFLGLNHYSTWLVSNEPNPPVFPISHAADMSVIASQDPTWGKSAATWLRVVPWGFRKILNWIKKEYGNPPVYVTENGFADLGQIDDTDRINYHKVLGYKLYARSILNGLYRNTHS